MKIKKRQQNQINYKSKRKCYTSIILNLRTYSQVTVIKTIKKYNKSYIDQQDKKSGK